ncbi:MAG: preprotein translocase subunit SecG [Bacteroidaceae bacterium]|nr:preprotein translocase subunit SecG [Bacteroidaceae bacterium]
MYSLLLILIVICAVLLCFIVTIQNSKGGGLAAGFSSSNQIMGVRKTTDFLEKSTWTLIALIVVMSIATAFVGKSGVSTSGPVMMQSATEEMMVNPESTPVYDVPATEIPALPAENE